MMLMTFEPDGVTRETRRATSRPGLSQPGGLIAAASEVISCERSPTSAADSDSTCDRIGVFLDLVPPLGTICLRDYLRIDGGFGGASCLTDPQDQILANPAIPYRLAFRWQQ